MHRYRSLSGLTVHHNSDFSGAAILTMLSADMGKHGLIQPLHVTGPAGAEYWQFEVPASDLVDFVLDHFGDASEAYELRFKLDREITQAKARLAELEEQRSRVIEPPARRRSQS